MSREKLEEILKYIEEQIHRRISLDELASIAGYSPFYFSRLFSEIMGMPVTAYIRIRRLQYAMASLLDGRKVLETALMYGFNSHEGFTRAFIQLFGIAPSKARSTLNEYRVPDYVVPDIDRRYIMDLCNNKQLQENLHQLVFEFLKQSLEEIQKGYCTEVKIVLLPGGRVCIRDNGRGIPLGKNIDLDQAVLDRILSGHPITKLEYSQMGDFSDAGLQTVNSLCENLQITVFREGMMFRQDYVRGIAQHEFMIQDTVHKSGMEVILNPDREIFGSVDFSVEIMKDWLQENMKRQFHLAAIDDRRVS